jgi:hypothetical protein
MTPTLKAPGTKRLKLQHDVPLYNFAFKFNLCRYNVKGLLQLAKSDGAGRDKRKDTGRAMSIMFATSFSTTCQSCSPRRFPRHANHVRHVIFHDMPIMFATSFSTTCTTALAM